MKLIIFFICVPFVYSELHTLTTLYTEINGRKIAGIPEISYVTELDGQQIDYYDSEIKKLIPRQDWVKEFASTEKWKIYTNIRELVQQFNIFNVHFAVQQLNQSHGVHTYQRMYGCWWNDKTKDSHGFDQYGYDGEDFISLDVKELRYITAVPQAKKTVSEWNNNRMDLKILERVCVDWLKYFLTLRKVDLEMKAPEVFLLQQDSSSPVSCHATGFYPSAVTISWLRNAQYHDEYVDLGETLPNEDGTFQKTVILDVPPEEWKKNQYDCLVEHEGKTIWTTVTKNNIKSNYGSSKAYLAIAVPVVGAYVLMYICAKF